MFFWNSLAFSMIQQMLAIWSLVPPLFLNPAWTFGSSQFTYYWSLAWRILSITLLVLRWMQLSSSLSILWHFLSLGLEWKLTFSSSVTFNFNFWYIKDLNIKIITLIFCLLVEIFLNDSKLGKKLMVALIKQIFFEFFLFAINSSRY